MNRVLSGLSQHPSKRIHDALLGRSDVIDLTVGLPDYGPPPRLAESIAQLTTTAPGDATAPHHRYADSRGLVRLRAAICERYRRDRGLRVAPDSEVLVTNGASEALALSILVASEPGDHVLIPDPGYPLYEAQVQVLGRRPVRVPTVSAEGFALDVAALAAACTDRARLLIVNSPSNPTGAVMSAEQAHGIVELAERRGLYVVHDEVLDNFVYEGHHIPIRAVADTQRTILINSASKSLGMPGWRLGWLVGAREIVAAAAKAHTYIELAVGHLGQLALAALLEAQDLAEQLRARHVVMRDRIRRVQAELTQLNGFAFSYEPRAGFYLFPRVSELHRRLGADAQDQCAGDVVAARLLDHAGVATVSGSAFGRTGSEHIRISIAGADSQLDAALERIAAVVGRLT